MRTIIKVGVMLLWPAILRTLSSLLFSAQVGTHDHIGCRKASVASRSICRRSSRQMEEQRNFGQETDRKSAMAGFTTAIV